jgi:hypothetical protein
MVPNSQECFTNILNERENHYNEISIIRLDTLSSPYFCLPLGQTFEATDVTKQLQDTILG